MSLKFLAKLADLPLPYRTKDPLELVHVDILIRAKLIVADKATPATGGAATVHLIESAGHLLLSNARPLLTNTRAGETFTGDLPIPDPE